MSRSNPIPRTALYKAPIPNISILDIPHFDEQRENELGVYIASRLHIDELAPVAIYISRDGGVTYTEQMELFHSAKVGNLLLANNDGGLTAIDGADVVNAPDERSKLIVQWESRYDLQGVSNNNLLNGENMLLVQGEVAQFRDTAFTDFNTTTASYLLRGRRGTEGATYSAVGQSRVVLLERKLPFLKLRHSDVGKTLYFKAVTNAMSLDNSKIVSMTFEGNGLKPFAPSNISAIRNGSNDVAISWNRRTRSIARLMGVKRLPYGEDTDDYEIDVLSPTVPRTVLRTIKVTAETVTYTASQQTADGLTLGNALFMRIYQMSNAVGRGQTNTVTLLATTTPNNKQYANHITV
tara:strand:+ start:2981 stop:4033 length:1053 start_codon:yes stop_codon:yes gene_type:complete